MRAIGVRFAADDFGTGYSCLRHLKCCPITTLKIDQSFVAGLADDTRDRTIVGSVIQLAHGLGMDVVAEGVETPGEPCVSYGKPAATRYRAFCSPSRCRRRRSPASSAKGAAPP